MADQNKPAAEHAAEVKFYSEILSPSELFAARARSHKIPVRGQKDFFPDDSEHQRRRLKQSLDEHWSLVSEERVERLGNLVDAVWIPSEGTVELQSPAGKFWQTMGFSANGKQCLLPEEALYLMECGNLQVFYQDLPLSIQEGYERFLSSKTLTLQQYQVFGHLKRLGYVVNRFDPSTVSSSYENQLNLKPSNDQSRRHQKRKRSDSPSPMPSHTAPEEGSVCDRTEVGEHDETVETDEKTPECPVDPPTPETPETQDILPTDPSPCPRNEGRSWWGTSSVEPGPPESPEQCPWWGTSSVEPGPPEPPVQSPRAAASSSGPRWDFHCIPFPDLGSRRSSSRRLASPDPSLLPGALAVGDCDVAPWLRRLNLREVRMSAGERRREEDRDRYGRHVNEDREVRRCSNWTEYHQLQEGRRRRRRHANRPPHLWERSVVPLHDPNRYTPTAELLEKISIVKSSNLLDGASSLTGDTEWRISFSVYQPDTVADFKKSNPGKPYSRLCVCSFQGPVPDLQTVKLLSFQSRDVPVTFAVVDHGDISFYTFKDLHLPTDVFP